MFLKLTKNSYIKHKPSAYIYCPYKDGIRDQLVINETASSILELCDGSHTLDDIVFILKKKYNDTEENVKNNVTDFIQPFISTGLVEEIGSEDFSNTIKGSKDIVYPDALVWELTDYCPLSCRHCYLSKKNHNIFSKDEIDDILYAIDEMGIYQVQLTGGEVLTHLHIEYVIHQLIKRGIITTISTSGMILNDNILNVLDELKLVKGSCCKVSLDGSQKTHNYIRQNENSYNNAVTFIKNVINRGIECQVGSVMLNQTKEEIEELTVLVKELGVSLLELALIVEQGNAKQNELHSNMTTKDFCNLLYELKNKYEDNNFLLKAPRDLTQKNCGAGHTMICIKANRNISPCPMLEMKLGNLKEERMQNILARCFAYFQDLVAPCKETCDKCEQYNACKSCIAQAIFNKDKVSKCKWYESENKLLKYFV